MKKNIKKIVKTLVLSFTLTALMGITAYGMKANDVINKNPAAYTAGSNSIYGPALNQTELNQVAEVIANFNSTYVVSNMTEEQKIRAAHDYLIYNCTYAADWSKNRANTAWGALVYGEAQCSGYARAFKALCDSMGIECMYIHADSNAINPSHQWNMVKLNGAWYYMDVQANATSGYDAFYLIVDYPMSYDKAGYPQISAASAQVNRHSYKSGPYADYIAPAPLSLETAMLLEFDFLPSECVDTINKNGIECFLIPSDSNMIQLVTAGGVDLNQYDLRLELFALEAGTIELLAEHTSNKLNERDPISLDFTGQDLDAASLKAYCQANNLIILGLVYDANQLLSYAQKNGGKAGIDTLLSGEVPSMELLFSY